MQRNALIIFAVTAAGTFIPCCGTDECCTGQATQKPANHQEEGNCSPFFACATCPGSVELARIIQLSPPVAEKVAHHAAIMNYQISGYSASFWQPPRFC